MKSLLLASVIFSGSLPARAYADPDWEAVTTGLLRAEKPGYGGLSGVVVDHQTGEIFVDLSDIGICRSNDCGDTWTRATKDALKGRTESPGCLLIDPTGRSKTLYLTRMGRELYRLNRG